MILKKPTEGAGYACRGYAWIPIRRSVLMVLALAAVSPLLRGQLAGITSSGNEMVLESVSGIGTAQVEHGGFSHSGVTSLTGVVAPGGSPAMGIAEGGRLGGALERRLRRGEHLRYELKVRSERGSGVFIGFESGAATFRLRILANGTVGYFTEDGWAIIAGLSHVQGEWQHYAIDHVVGADQVLLTVGRVQVPVAVRMLDARGGASVDIQVYASCDASSQAAVGVVRAWVVLEERLRDLPVFGRISWSRASMAFVEAGPSGGISGHAAVTDADGRLYVAGGFIPAGDASGDSDHRSSQWAHRYDPDARSWTQLADMPGRREYVSGAGNGNTIYVFGGGKQRGTPSGTYTPHGSVFAMDVSVGSPRWVELPELGIPRTHLSTGVWNNRLIASGGNEYNHKVVGYHPSTIRGTTEVLDLANVNQGWREVASIPGARRGWSASVAARGKFFLFGGLTFEPVPGNDTRMRKIRLRETLAYDFAADSWSALSPFPYPACGWRGALYQDRYAILVGGTYESEHRSAYRWSAQALVYDTLEDRWYRLLDSALPPGAVYNDPGVAVAGNTIYVSGGEAIAGAHYNTLLIGNITRWEGQVDGFENTAQGALPAGYTVVSGEGEVSPAEASSGSRSLRISDDMVTEVAKVVRLGRASASPILQAQIRPVAAPYGNIISLASGDGGNECSVFHLRVVSNGSLLWYDGSAWSPLASAGAIPMGEWSDLRVEAHVGDGASAEVFVNGVSVGKAGRWNRAATIDRVCFMSGSAAGVGDEFHLDDVVFSP